ncbi:hypothetical protein [Mycobacterium avium]|uniref:hypothetical protein n=1 Tax=Mycobacterium avium TaxID=1764 RepID=UPI00111C3F6A|nr:hypothetical protein [Mycobacterium avium]
MLEQMFTGWTARELFARAEPRRGRTADSGLLASIPPAVDPPHLVGLWVTAFIFDNLHHVDLTTITIANNAVTARNSPPSPRTEGHAVGFHNDISFSLFGRHLIGQWPAPATDTSTEPSTWPCFPEKRSSTVSTQPSSPTPK